jgi:hypothetical protein
MSLKLLQPGTNPLGQFDGLDSDALTLKGGEIVSFASVTTLTTPGVSQAGLDAGAYDVFDGYINVGGTFKRPAVSRKFDGSTTLSSSSRPLMLSDDGITGYGTLFGTVVGGTIGQVSYGPSSTVAAANLLGPHTATGSGKVTCWDKPGLYAVSLDAVDTTAGTGTGAGLTPANTSLSVGAALTFTFAGLLCPLTSSEALSGAPTVAHLVEFNTNQSLVTTPNYLVAALNSPSGNVGSTVSRAFQFATIYFAPPVS